MTESGDKKLTVSDLMDNPHDETPLPGAVDRTKDWWSTNYKDTFPLEAYTMLSQGKKGKTHLAKKFSCSLQTINRWITKKEEFALAVEAGLAVGESLFVDSLMTHAFSPVKDVNNGLIKMLASRIYGITDEPQIIVHNTAIANGTDAEEEMKKRGIPVPDISLEDVDDE